MNWKLCLKSDKKEIRKIYGETLDHVLSHQDDIVIADADLSSSSGAGYLFEKYPGRSINFGICEQNMIGAGAGMSFTGLKPFVHSFAPFVSRRVVDQIFMSLAFAKGNMHIYASDPGYWSQYNGATHTTFEDIAIMRSIPNVCVVAPSDATTFAWILNYYAQHGGIIYNRCTRKPLPSIYTEDSSFAYGKGQWLKHGQDIALISIGDGVSDCLEVAKQLAEEGIHVSVIDLFFIKPYDKQLLHTVFASHKSIITVENHNRIGGIGELVGSELAQSEYHCRFKMLAIDDCFGQVGTVDYLKEIYHVSIADIEQAIREEVKKW